MPDRQNAATPGAMFDILTANGVPREQAMALAFGDGPGDGYDSASASSVAPRVASVFPDPPALQSRAATDPGSAGIRRRPEGGYDLDPSYLNPRPEERRVPGIDPGQAGIRPPPGGGYYFYSRPEERHASGWDNWVRPETRESLGLSPERSEQFAGVPLRGDASGGYGIDPNYEAQMRTALNTERYVPTLDELVSNEARFSSEPQALPFRLAGPGSLNFDPSLESNTRRLKPFERSLEDVQRESRPRHAGSYWGGYVGIPLGRRSGPKGGAGGGLYVDDNLRIYPQTYIGSPGGGFTWGHSDDLDSQLTGTSGTGSIGRRGGRFNLGAGMLTGYGPYDPIGWIKRHLP